MPLSTVKPLMAEAKALLASSKLAGTDEILDICEQSLGFFIEHADAYCSAIPYCKEYVPHFRENLSELVRLLNAPQANVPEGFSLFGEAHMIAFALVEDMALFVREKVLRDGAVTEHPFEEKLLSYFETCGNWQASSGEVVTDTYYNRLPISVMKSMAQSSAPRV